MTVNKIDGVDGQVHDLRHIVTLVATGAISAGDVVMIDDGASTALVDNYGDVRLIRVADALDTPLAVGVALESVDAPSGPALAAGIGAEVRVQVGGKIGTGDTGAPTAVAAGVTVALPVGVDTAGDLQALTAADITTSAFAVCLSTYSASSDDGIIAIIDKGFYNY